MAAAQSLLSGGESAFLGPTYNYAEELTPPSQIGVRVGDSFDQVYTNIKGVNYYVDAIGFGQGTFLNDNPMHPLGLRYFLDTGFQCSNGAERYEFIDTTPQGDSLGPLIQKELTAEGLPALRGLAPGMLEDAERALNPIPLFKAVLSDSGYCNCTQVEKAVGDLKGSIISKGGSPWINVADVYYKDGAGNKYTTPGSGRTPYQTKWVKDQDITADVFNATPKIYNPDGSARSTDDQRVDAGRSAGGLEPFTSSSHMPASEAGWGRGAAGAVVLVAALAFFAIRANLKK